MMLLVAGIAIGTIVKKNAPKFGIFWELKLLFKYEL
jgi:hypothetical protein